jgi:hypothetical protein
MSLAGDDRSCLVDTRSWSTACFVLSEEKKGCSNSKGHNTSVWIECPRVSHTNQEIENDGTVQKIEMRILAKQHHSTPSVNKLMC